MEEWKEYKLGEVISTVKDRIETSFLDENTYISTENMLPNKSGITLSSGVPSGNAIKFQKGDVLISNIRPYFKKIWHADRDGGCSGDVLCFRPSSQITSSYLYFLLSQDLFFDFVMLGAKGTKMPRGDKSHILQWPILLPSLSVQCKVASILKSLDDKIENNRRINENLEQQAQALFKSWFIDFEPFKNGKFVESELGLIPEGWRVGCLNEIAIINPLRPLKRGQQTTYLDMKNMPTTGSFPTNWETKEYSGGMKFMNSDTIMARITPCLENGKVAFVNFLEKEEIAFGSTEYIVMTTKESFMPELLYFLCRDDSFKGYATKNMNGSSGRQRVSGETIGNYKIPIPPKDIIEPLAPFYSGVMNIIRKNGMESRRLAELRDTLLPRLMSGELKVNEIEELTE